MRSSLMFLALSLPACAAGPDPLGEEHGEIEISVAPPPEVNCLGVRLVDQADEVFEYTFDIATQVTLPPVRVGAYLASASAYAATDCANIPARPPWGTLRPSTVLVTRGLANVPLRLYRVGSVTVGTEFVETPEVVATNQPRIGQLAADQHWVAWVHRPGSDLAGSVHALEDNPTGTGTVIDVATGRQRPSDITIHPTGAVFWTEFRTAPDASNGGVYSWDIGLPVTTVATGQTPGEIAAAGGRVYWTTLGSELRSATLDFAVQPPIGGQLRTNAVTVDATHVYWSTDDDRAIRRAAHGSTTAIDVVPSGIETAPAIGLAVDATHVYWVDWDAANTSVIKRVPITGGLIEQVFPPAGEPRFAGIWPVEVDNGYVYFAGGGAVYRVPASGNAPAELIQDGAISGFALSRWGGHRWLYWGDREFGGVVWRQRLD